MNFAEILFSLSERVYTAFVDLGYFFTNGRFLDRILETLENATPNGSLINIFTTVITWILNQLNPQLLSCSFAELLLITGVPLIIVLSFVTWLWKILPIA